MKLFLLLSCFATFLLSNSDCSEKKVARVKYKGRLEVAGICKNYTISVIEGNIDTNAVVASWKDEATQKTYNKAFKLGNPCDFPATIKAGDEFYFTIDTTTKAPCVVCMAYYPTPSKALSIKVAE